MSEEVQILCFLKTKLRCIDTHLYFSTICTKVDNFCDFLLTSVSDSSLKGVHSSRDT